MAKVAVTGAAGFLGSNLVDLLVSRRATVAGLDNLSTGRLENLRSVWHHRGFTFQRADLARSATLPRAEKYYHLASPASPPAYQREPISTLLVNSTGTHRVLEAARRADARVLIASTSEVYGDATVHPQPERYWGSVNPIGVRSCYDEGKRFSEALAVAYRRSYGLDVRIARIFNTYGPRMDPADGRVISNFVVQGLRGEPLTIYGDGSQTRSFCYVSDLVAGLDRLMEAPKEVPTPMNLGNPAEVPIRRVAELVSQALEIPLRLDYRPLPEDDPKQRCPDIGLARQHLGWTPTVGLEAGLPSTVASLRASLSAEPQTRPRRSKRRKGSAN